MLMNAEQSVLVLIDIQEKLMPAIHQGEAVTQRCITLASIAGLLDVPVIGTEQVPEKLGPNLKDIRERCDVTLAKTHFGACPDGLAEKLPAGRKDVLIAGCETHVCLLQSALGLLEAGYRVWVAADACGSRYPSDREIALQRLAASGAMLVTTEMVAFEWMRHCNHPRFREVQALIK